MATGAEKLREFRDENSEDKRKREDQHTGEIAEGLLLLLIGTAVLDTNAGGKIERADGGTDTVHCRAKVRSLEAAADQNDLLQVLLRISFCGGSWVT